jgi:hypothetical protein
LTSNLLALLPIRLLFAGALLILHFVSNLDLIAYALHYEALYESKVEIALPPSLWAVFEI